MSMTDDQISFLASQGGLKLAALGKDGLPEGSDLTDLWLEFLAQRREEEVNDARRRDFLLAQALATVDKHAPELRAAFDFQVEVGGESMDMLDERHGNQEDEVDTIDVLKRAQTVTDKTSGKVKKKGEKVKTKKGGERDDTLLQKASRAYDTVAEESRRLETSTTLRSTMARGDDKIASTVVALFEANQIGELFYTPLVRARLIPENVVIGKFSQTQRMLDKTVSYYMAELKDASDPTVNVAGAAKTAVGIGGQVANLITAQFGVDTQAVQTMIEAGVALIDLTIDGANAIHHGIEQTDVDTLCSQFPAVLGTLIGAATGNDQVGEAVSAVGAVAGTAASNLYKVAKQKGRISPVDITNMVKAQIAAVLTAAVTLDNGATPGLDQTCKLLEDAATCIDAAKVGKIVDGLKTGNWRDVSSGVLGMLADVAAAAPQLAEDGAAISGVTIGGGTQAEIAAASVVISKGMTLMSLTVSARDAGEVASAFESELPGILGQVLVTATGDQTMADLVTSNAAAGLGLAALIIDSVSKKRVDPAVLSAALTDTINAVFDDVETADIGDALDPVEAARTSMLQVATAVGSSPDAATLLDPAGGPDATKAKRKAAGKILLQLLMAAPAAAQSEVDASPLDSGTKNKVDAVLVPVEDVMEAMMQKVEDAETAKDPAVSKAMEDIQAKLDRDYREGAEKKALEQMDAVLAQREEHQKAIRDAMNPDADQKKILELIKVMERDQKILKIAIAIGSAGAEVAAQFFAPLAIGKEIIMMVANMAAAVQRAVDLKKMMEAQDWAESATSVYRSAIDNFVRNQAAQLTEYSIKAAMNAIRIASEVAATAYPQAKAVAAGVAIAQQAVNAGFVVAKEVDLKRAWAVTKTALMEPENRRAMLKAQRLNATLAKYAIAYGAFEAGDPVAVKTMNEIGLTNDMLGASDAGVPMVKAWLVARFSDDARVTGTWSPDAEWQKGLPAPALSSVSMMNAYKLMGLAAQPFFPGKSPSPGFAKARAAPILAKLEATQKAYATAGKAAIPLRATAAAETATLDDKKKLLAAVQLEIERGNEAMRLAGLMCDALTKDIAEIAGAVLALDDRDKTAFRAQASALVMEYRQLGEDEVEQIQGDLLPPAMEVVSLSAATARMKKQPV